MNLALIGRKIGSTMRFSENGRKITELTAILISPNFVSQIKTKEKEGYDALQIAFEDCKESSLNKSQIFHLEKNRISPKRFLKEVKGSYSYILGEKIDLKIFSEKEKVKVTAKSKGKGFSGVIKRHNQSRGPMAHGSGYHRGVGSMGSIAPNRVPKGKNLPGREGSKKTTINNLVIHKIVYEKNIIFVEGSVPGPSNGIVIVSKNK